MEAMLFDVVRGSYVDGPGIRTTVFFKGCNLRCAWCHNPESQSPQRELLVYRSLCRECGNCRAVCPHEGTRCDRCGKCALFCPSDARKLCGKRYTVEDVLDEVLADVAVYRATGGGVTCSGGECLLQPDFTAAVLRACRKNGIHTAIDTAGAVPWSVMDSLLPVTDLVLYDVKCMDSTIHRRYTGVDNADILDNLAKLLTKRVPVWIRIPVIGGVNDTVEEMRAVRQFTKRYGTPERVELLPFHAMGKHKYEALGREYTAFPVPTEETMRRLRAVFET